MHSRPTTGSGAGSDGGQHQTHGGHSNQELWCIQVSKESEREEQVKLLGSRCQGRQCSCMVILLAALFSFPLYFPSHSPLLSLCHISALVCADVTFIEPETRGQVLRGLDFYKFKFSNGQRALLCCATVCALGVSWLGEAPFLSPTLTSLPVQNNRLQLNAPLFSTHKWTR